MSDKNRKERINELLKSALHPEYLDIIDDSASHSGHNEQAREAGESHFSITIVAQSFADIPKVKRHKMVYEALKSEMEGANAIHALQLKTITPKEVEEENNGS